jgi:hypothetical protein
MKNIIILLFLFLSVNIFTNELMGQWENVSSLNCGYNTCGISFKNNILIGSALGCVNISSDDGKSFKKNENGIEGKYEIISFTFWKNDLFLINAFEGIYLLKLKENTWEKFVNLPKYSEVTSLKCIGDDIIVGVYKPEELSGVYLLKNGSKSMKLISNKWKVKMLANIDTIIFASVENKGIYYTNNFGDNWYECNNRISSLNVKDIKQLDGYLIANTNKGFDILDKEFFRWNSIKAWDNKTIRCFITYKNNIIVNVNNTGIFVSNNYGNSWLEKNEGLIKNSLIGDFMALEFNDQFVHKDYVYALNLKNTIFRIQLSEIIIINPETLDEK